MPDNAPHRALRHHVSGAVDRGEAEPLTEKPAHHPDCDGWRTAHKRTIYRENNMRRISCEECGESSPLVGDGVTDASLADMLTCETTWVECAGQCQTWDAGQ